MNVICILTGTAVHRSMLYQLRKHCIIKVLMRLLPAAAVHTSCTLGRNNRAARCMIITQYLRGSEIRWRPITATTRHENVQCAGNGLVMSLQFARYAVHGPHGHMAICAHYHYICDGRSLRF